MEWRERVVQMSCSTFGKMDGARQVHSSPIPSLSSALIQEMAELSLLFVDLLI
jgi:hypothetical protein